MWCLTLDEISLTHFVGCRLAMCDLTFQQRVTNLVCLFSRWWRSQPPYLCPGPGEHQWNKSFHSKCTHWLCCTNGKAAARVMNNIITRRRVWDGALWMYSTAGEKPSIATDSAGQSDTWAPRLSCSTFAQYLCRSLSLSFSMCIAPSVPFAWHSVIKMHFFVHLYDAPMQPYAAYEFIIISSCCCVCVCFFFSSAAREVCTNSKEHLTSAEKRSNLLLLVCACSGKCEAAVKVFKFFQ